VQDKEFSLMSLQKGSTLDPLSEITEKLTLEFA